MADQTPPDESATAEAAETAEAARPAPPVLRVVSPHATAEEVAALVAVLSALGGDEPARPRPVPEWSRPARRHRAPVAHGPGGWRASGLPR